MPKFAHVSDIHVNKYRGKIILDGSSLLYPRVVGLKGRFSMDVYTGEPRPHTAVTDLPSTANPPVSTPIAPTVGEKEGKKANAKGKEDGKTGTKKSREFFINLYLTNISTLLTKTSVQNLYKNLGSTICLEVTLEKPLLDKKRLQPVKECGLKWIWKIVVVLTLQLFTCFFFRLTNLLETLSQDGLSPLISCLKSVLKKLMNSTMLKSAILSRSWPRNMRE